MSKTELRTPRARMETLPGDITDLAHRQHLTDAADAMAGSTYWSTTPESATTGRWSSSRWRTFGKWPRSTSSACWMPAG
jgi:hypothetical protein